MNVAVVGLGGTGAAAAHSLAKRGHRVIGLERFQQGHRLGSSHGHSRIIRYTYPDELYTGLMQDAYPLWRALEESAEQELLVQCGGLFFGPAGHPEVEATARALRHHGIAAEWLEAEDVARRHPGLRLARGERGIWQAESGFLRAGEAVEAQQRLAREAGAELHFQEEVLGIVQRGSHLHVETTHRWCEVDAVIVSAGAWMSRLLRDLWLPLRVTRQEIAYLGPASPPAEFEPGSMPVWIDAASLWYGFPNDGCHAGIKLAHHVPGPDQDPDGGRAAPREEQLEATRRYAASRLPGLTAEVMGAETCLYTSTPSEDFVLDRHPTMRNCWLVSGCSGHGFKFTVLLGEIAARLATGEEYPRDLTRFSLAAHGVAAAGRR